MSKIIVDQVQKNGGTALTLPASDASTANQPLVSNASGTLAFSPLSLPASDPGANKFLTSDGSNQLQASSFSVPAATGTNGQFLTSDGAGAATWTTPAASGGFDGVHVTDFNANSAGSVQVLWTDVISGVTHSDIAEVQCAFIGVSASSACYFRIYGRNASGQISSGYLANTYHMAYNGNQTASTNNNGNSGYWQIPNYSQVAQTDYSYGSGLTGLFTWHTYKEGTYGNYMISGQMAYQQNTSYNHPNVEQVAWDSYATNNPPASATHGLQLTCTAGSMNRGFFVVRLKKKS